MASIAAIVTFSQLIRGRIRVTNVAEHQDHQHHQHDLVHTTFVCLTKRWEMEKPAPFRRAVGV